MITVLAAELLTGLNHIETLTKTNLPQQELLLIQESGMLYIHSYGSSTFIKYCLPIVEGGEFEPCVIPVKSLSEVSEGGVVQLTLDGKILTVKDKLTKFDLTTTGTPVEFLYHPEPDDLNYQPLKLNDLKQIIYASGEEKLNQDVVWFFSEYAMCADGVRIASLKTNRDYNFTLTTWQASRLARFDYMAVSTSIWAKTERATICFPTIESGPSTILISQIRQPRTYNAMFTMPYDDLNQIIKKAILTSASRATDIYGKVLIKLQAGKLEFIAGGNELGGSESTITPITSKGEFLAGFRPTMIRDVLQTEAARENENVSIYITSSVNGQQLMTFYVGDLTHHILPIHIPDYFTSKEVYSYGEAN